MGDLSKLTQIIESFDSDRTAITNTIKELLKKGGLRCEILTNGTICKGDIIKIFK